MSISSGGGAGKTSSPWGTPPASAAGNQESQGGEAVRARTEGERKKSLTLQAMGAKMIAEGRSPADLTLEDLKQLDPQTLPPKLRVKVQPQHPLYVRESASYGKQEPNEFQKPPTVCACVRASACMPLVCVGGSVQVGCVHVGAGRAEMRLRWAAQ